MTSKQGKTGFGLPPLSGAASDAVSLATGRRFRAGAPPKDATLKALIALLGSVATVAASWATLADVRAAAASLGYGGTLVDGMLALVALGATLIVWPALCGLRYARHALRALAAADLIAARVAAAESRKFSWIAFGYSAAQALLLLAVLFLIANNLAVSKTFFMLPLMFSSWTLVLKAFWINVYIFMVAEIIVLVWSLLVAVALLAPGEAGKPIRLIATVYVDVFRSLPAIITIYLIGYGIPLTNLPILKDFSQQSFVIFALVLSSGAYVAEIYRAGIESIHQSQTAAARSLGLSYLDTLRFIVIPQGVRLIVPPLLNSFIALQKDTALVNVIGAIDAFNQAMMIASNHYNLSAVTTVAFLFVLITIPQSRLVKRMVERDRRRLRA